MENAFLFANNILNRISDNLSKVSKQNLKIVDYNLILERISRELNINKKQILQGLSNEKLLINHLTKRLDYLQCNLTKLRQLINKTYEIYKKFGGKQDWNTAKINAAVSIAGFLNGYTTLLQFFREFNF